MTSNIPAFEFQGNFLPAIAYLLMQLEQQQGLLIRPCLLIHLRVEMIVPSLSALLARSRKVTATLPHLLSDDSPIVDTLFHHHLAKGTVLLYYEIGTLVLQFLRMSEI